MIGFMSPDGSFTACKVGKHLDLAKMLVSKHYHFSLDGVKAEQFLLSSNWIEFRQDEILATPEEDIISQEQRRKCYEWSNSQCCNFHQRELLKELLHHDMIMQDGILASM